MRRNGTKTSSFGTNGRINHDSEKFYSSKLYKDLSKQKEVTKAVNVFPEKFLNKNILRSAENMPIPDRSVHLMITSPPITYQKNMMRICL